MMTPTITIDTLSCLKKPQLQELLVQNNLKKSGNKPVLIQRLLLYFHQNTLSQQNTTLQQNTTSQQNTTLQQLSPINNTISQNVIFKNETIPFEAPTSEYWLPNIEWKLYNILRPEDIQQLITIIETNPVFFSIKTFFHDILVSQIVDTRCFFRLDLKNYSLNCKKKRYPKKCIVSKQVYKYLYEIQAVYELMTHAKKFEKQLQTIQAFYKHIQLIRENKKRGPAFLNRSLCKNQEDFLTYNSIKHISPISFYSFQDKDTYIYGFDIKSIGEYIINSENIVNPYNNNKMEPNIQKEIISLYQNMILQKRIIINKPKLTIQQKTIDRSVKIFQRMDMLNNYTDVNWFLKLDIFKLKKLYQSAEDIWNYRAMDLTIEVRKKHIPKNNAFPLKPYHVFKFTDTDKIRNIILDEFEKFIYDGVTKEECKTGAMWMLTALVEVSKEAAAAMIWLVQ
jgi:hypothetical protein